MFGNSVICLFLSSTPIWIFLIGDQHDCGIRSPSSPSIGITELFHIPWNLRFAHGRWRSYSPGWWFSLARSVFILVCCCLRTGETKEASYENADRHTLKINIQRRKIKSTHPPKKGFLIFTQSVPKICLCAHDICFDTSSKFGQNRHFSPKNRRFVTNFFYPPVFGDSNYTVCNTRFGWAHISRSIGYVVAGFSVSLRLHGLFKHPKFRKLWYPQWNSVQSINQC